MQTYHRSRCYERVVARQLQGSEGMINSSSKCRLRRTTTCYPVGTSGRKLRLAKADEKNIASSSRNCTRPGGCCTDAAPPGRALRSSLYALDLSPRSRRRMAGSLPLAWPDRVRMDGDASLRPGPGQSGMPPTHREPIGSAAAGLGLLRKMAMRERGIQSTRALGRRLWARKAPMERHRPGVSASRAFRSRRTRRLSERHIAAARPKPRAPPDETEPEEEADHEPPWQDNRPGSCCGM